MAKKGFFTIEKCYICDLNFGAATEGNYAGKYFGRCRVSNGVNSYMMKISEYQFPDCSKVVPTVKVSDPMEMDFSFYTIECDLNGSDLVMKDIKSFKAAK